MEVRAHLRADETETTEVQDGNFRLGFDGIHLAPAWSTW